MCLPLFLRFYLQYILVSVADPDCCRIQNLVETDPDPTHYCGGKTYFLQTIFLELTSVTRCHRGGRMRNINAWYLNTHMVYL